MSKLKLLFALLIAVGVMIVGWVVSSENNQLVSPVLFGYGLPRWNLGVWLLLMLLIGGLLGWLISIFSYFRYVGRSRSLQRRLSSRDQEISRLRASSMKD